MTQIRDVICQALQSYTTRHGGPAEWSRALRDDEWNSLVDSGLVRAFENGTLTPEMVAKRVYISRRSRQRAPRHSPSVQRTATQRRRNEHDGALADILALHCERESPEWRSVKAFRQDVLRNHLVSDLDAWLEAHARQQGKPTIRAGRARLVAVRIGDEVMHRATRIGKPLDRLRNLSERLSGCYGWSRADAATFVLTGKTPPVRSITTDIRLATPMLARSTITLTVNPSATPDEVAEAYSRGRTEALGRVKRLRARHARLAAFVYREGQADETSFAKWNRAHPRWRYAFLSTFRRDAQLALNSLVELRPQRQKYGRTDRLSLFVR